MTKMVLSWWSQMLWIVRCLREMFRSKFWPNSIPWTNKLIKFWIISEWKDPRTPFVAVIVTSHKRKQSMRLSHVMMIWSLLRKNWRAMNTRSNCMRSLIRSSRTWKSTPRTIDASVTILSIHFVVGNYSSNSLGPVREHAMAKKISIYKIE